MPYVVLYSTWRRERRGDSLFYFIWKLQFSNVRDYNLLLWVHMSKYYKTFLLNICVVNLILEDYISWPYSRQKLGVHIYICVCVYIYIYIYHHQVELLAWISLTLSLSLTIYPYYSFLLPGLLDYILCLYRAVVGKLLLVSQYWHVHVKGSLENITYKFVFASLAYLDGFRDRRLVTIQLCGMLLPGFVQYSL